MAGVPRHLGVARLVMALGCLIPIASPVSAQSWIGTSGGEWNNTANWNPATVPNATGATATFVSAGTVNLSAFTATVGTLDATLSTGSLVLGSNSTTTDIINLATSSGTQTL